MSPSQFLLENAHRPDAEIPVGKDVIDYWREGHPNFKPFKIKQKVIREIPRVGDRAIYKLLPKYDGPYTVQKVHSNGLSYDIVKEDDEQERIIKSHHTKLRAFNELPYEIGRFIPEVENHMELPIRECHSWANTHEEIRFVESDTSGSFEGFGAVAMGTVSSEETVERNGR